MQAEEFTIVTREAKTHRRRSWSWWRWTFTCLNIFALALSTILSWHYIKGGPQIGCSGGSPCDVVLDSQWSMVAGVLPVSSLAVGVYLALLVAGLFIGPAVELSIRRLAWSAILILAGSIAGSAIWFTIIQKSVIGKFCLYCMTTHITGLLLTALVIWRAITKFDGHAVYVPAMSPLEVKNVSQSGARRIIRPLHAVCLVLAGLILAGILAALQAGFSSSAVYQARESHSNLPAIDYRGVPIVGSPDAPYIVTFLFDYECQHCQQIHLLLDEVVSRYDSKLAFVLCPTPLSTRCNPYIPQDADGFKNSCEFAKIGLALWLVKRESFYDFENWIFKYESGDRWHPPSLESAKAKAIELVGRSKFDTARANPWIGQYMQTCIKIYGQTFQNGYGGVPKMIFGSRWIIPEPHNVDELIMILQKSLGIPEP